MKVMDFALAFNRQAAKLKVIVDVSYSKQDLVYCLSIGMAESRNTHYKRIALDTAPQLLFHSLDCDPELLY